MAKTKAEIDKNYEERHKEERKEKYLVWGTCVSRKFAEEVNAFLKENGYTKVRLIEAGYKLLKEEAAGNKKTKPNEALFLVERGKI